MWGRGKKTVVPAKQLTSVIDGLKEVYFSKVRPTRTTASNRPCFLVSTDPPCYARVEHTESGASACALYASAEMGCWSVV